MGLGRSKVRLPPEAMEAYARRFFFTRPEIETLYQRWVALGGSLKNLLPAQELLRLPELSTNPFRFRILEVFGEISDDAALRAQQRAADAAAAAAAGAHADEKEHGYGPEGADGVEATLFMSFLGFLKMFNAFSHRADIKTKAWWAFRIYDFDGDGFLSTEDIVQLVELTVGKGRLPPAKLLEVASEVLDEADLDGNHRLSKSEFSRIIQRVPDFMAKFRFVSD